MLRRGDLWPSLPGHWLKRLVLMRLRQSCRMFIVSWCNG
jgi:hypothetical protein